MNVAKYLGLLIDSERLLSDALITISDRHSRDPEIHEVAKTLAGWARADAEAMRPFVERYGHVGSADPERLRDALFHDPRIGGLGLLRDLHDAGILAHHVHYCWLALYQVAQSQQDEELEEACLDLGTHVDRTIAWIDTHVRSLAPQALGVRSDARSEIVASIPRVPLPDAIPDLSWAPVAGAIVAACAGALAVLTGMPLLVPSLGPSAFLIAAEPAHPSSRVYNTIAGHAIAVGVGAACVAMLGAWSEPTIVAGAISAARVLASILAVFGTLLVTLLARADHAPAAASALLVTLGIAQRPEQMLAIVLGARVVALAGALVRRLRSGSWRGRPDELTERTRPAAGQPVH